MSLTVTIPDTFNGPLDLLLHLIRRDEMDIYDIPIAKLATTYLEEMNKLEIVDVDEAAEFLDLASRLLEIKSRMLMPPEEADDEGVEDEDEFDPRTDLVEALLEYRRFKDAAKMLGDLADEQARRYPRIAPRFEFHFEESEAASDSADLMRAFQNLLIKMLPNEDSTVITYTEVPTSVRIEQITTVLRDVDSTRFSLLLSGRPDRREMVGFFIAMLELVRQGVLVARQSDNFADIILERRTQAAPTGKTVACRTPSRPAPRFLPVPARKVAVTSVVRHLTIFPPPAPVKPHYSAPSRRLVPSFP